MSSSRTLLLAALLAGFCLRSTAAHDIQASNVTLCIRSTGIDVELTMALASGTLLIAHPNEPIAITPNSFHDYAERLQSIGPALLTLTTSDKKNLSSDAAVVSLTAETDILYDLHFPLPPPGPFSLHAAYLDRMPTTHIASFRVLNAQGDELASGDVRPDAPDFLAQMPSKETPSSPNVNPTPTPITTRPADNIRWILRAIVAATLFVIILIAWRALSRQKSDDNSSSKP